MSDAPSSTADKVPAGNANANANAIANANVTNASEPTFEDAVRRLSEIVQTLERGELPLEDSLHLFEEGVKLSRLSQARLDRAEKKVERLLAVDERGQPKVAPFDRTGDE